MTPLQAAAQAVIYHWSQPKPADINALEKALGAEQAQMVSKSFAEVHPANPNATCDCEHWQSCAECHPTAHSAPPPAEPTIKQPLSTERAELINALDAGSPSRQECHAASDMLEADDQEMSNLLARIHRDGGHYEAEHGRQKSVIAADLIVANLNALSDAQQVAVPAGYVLAMAVLQSSLYQWLDDVERAECDALIAAGQSPQGDTK